MPDKVAYSVRELTYETGLSTDKIIAAINSGDLKAKRPVVNGKAAKGYIVLHAWLIEWLERGKAP